MTSIPHLALGTVQFGLNYGVANKTGRPTIQEIDNILNIARCNLVDCLDTAINYGESESILGEVGVADFKVITKLPSKPQESINIQSWVYKEVESSLKRLKIDTLYGILLHRSSDLSKNDADILYNTLLELKKNDLVKKIGISIYNYKELEILKKFNLDIVQTPINLIDREIIISGWLEELHSKNIEVHSRSAFLQGLLLMDSSERDKKFARWNFVWNIWDNWSGNNKQKKIKACLQFLKSHTQISRIVIGVDSSNHLKDIVELFSEEIDFALENLNNMQSRDEELINPSLWSKI